MIKKWNEYNSLNEGFRDDNSGKSLQELMETTSTYKDSVACDLTRIITNERGISEKAFTAYDEVMTEVEKFYEGNYEEIDSLVGIHEANNWRSNFLAETLYNKYFQTEIINEKKDFENVAKPKDLAKKMQGVSLGKSKSGKYFVYTHRARCKYYDNPEDIPQKEIDFIKSTG